MGILLLGITLILWGISMFTAFLPNTVIAILLIITGAVLILENRGILHR